MSADGTHSPVVRADRLSHFFGTAGARAQVLFDVSLEIDPGSLVILTGPSGSGKTTLLTLMGAMRTIQEGRMEVHGQIGRAHV